MTEIRLNSIEELNAHVAALPPCPDVDIWWTCPNCRTKNFGISLSRDSPCPECREYEHPPAGTPPKSPLDLQIEALEAEISGIEEDKIWPLEDELDELKAHVRKKRRELERLRALSNEKRGKLGGVE